jgi:hypothetical protein
MLLAASAPAIRCACVSMSLEREPSAKGKNRPQGAGHAQQPPRSGLHMCVLNSRKTQAKVSFCIATGSVVILSGNLGRGWKYNADSGERLEENIMYKEAIGQKDALWSYFGGNTKVHAQQLSANYTHKHEQG